MNQEAARMGEKQMEWKRYQRQGVIEARPSRMSDITEHSRGNPISVSDADARQWPLIGDKGYVARNPDNHADQWYIAPDYFAKHYADESCNQHSQLLERCAELEKALRERVKNCIACDGKGYVYEGEAITGRGPDDVFPEKVACEDCADLRDALAFQGEGR